MVAKYCYTKTSTTNFNSGLVSKFNDVNSNQENSTIRFITVRLKGL